MSKHCEGCCGTGRVQVGEPNNMGVRVVERRPCPGISDDAEQRVIAFALEISNVYPPLTHYKGFQGVMALSPQTALVPSALIAKLRIALGCLKEQP